jgi:hypothetical protein
MSNKIKMERSKNNKRIQNYKINKNSKKIINN